MGRSTAAHAEVTQAQLAEVLPLLPALAKAMTRRSHEVPAAIKSQWHEHGLAPRHMNLLVTLALGGAMSVTDLSGRLGIGLATTSLLVLVLERLDVGAELLHPGYNIDRAAAAGTATPIDWKLR